MTQPNEVTPLRAIDLPCNDHCASDKQWFFTDDEMRQYLAGQRAAYANSDGMVMDAAGEIIGLWFFAQFSAKYPNFSNPVTECLNEAKEQDVLSSAEDLRDYEAMRGNNLNNYITQTPEEMEDEARDFAESDSQFDRDLDDWLNRVNTETETESDARISAQVDCPDCGEVLCHGECCEPKGSMPEVRVTIHRANCMSDDCPACYDPECMGDCPTQVALDDLDSKAKFQVTLGELAAKWRHQHGLPPVTPAGMVMDREVVGLGREVVDDGPTCPSDPGADAMDTLDEYLPGGLVAEAMAQAEEVDRQFAESDREYDRRLTAEAMVEGSDIPVEEAVRALTEKADRERDQGEDNYDLDRRLIRMIAHHNFVNSTPVMVAPFELREHARDSFMAGLKEAIDAAKRR